MTTSTMRKTVTSEEARLRTLAAKLDRPDGGFSIRPLTGESVTGGYVVAVAPECEQQITGRVTPEDVRAYAYTHAATLIRTGAVLSGWRDPSTGVAYLDVSRVVGTREEAARLAVAHNQLAYFDLHTGQSVDV